MAYDSDAEVLLEDVMDENASEVVYCDAGFFDNPKTIRRHKGNAIVAILYKKELTRISVTVKSSMMAELLGIILAKRLYPNKLVVNDCKAVVDVFSHRSKKTIMRWTGRNDVNELVEFITEHGVMWQRRRSCPKACIVDTATRVSLSPNYRRLLKIGQYILKDWVM